MRVLPSDITQSVSQLQQRDDPTITIARYAGGVVAVIATLLVQLALTPIIGQSTPFLLFFAPVIFTAWWAGLRPALLVVCVAAGLISYYLLEPRYNLLAKEPGDLLALALYIGESILFSSLISALLNTQQRVQLANTEITAAGRRMSFLADASAILNRSLELPVMLPELVEKAVPAIADWCIVTLDGVPPQRYVAGTLPVDDSAARVSADGAGAGVAALAIPIAIRGMQVGVLAVGSNQAVYGVNERGLLEELARRIATAIENTQLFQAANELNQRLEERVSERTRSLERALGELRVTNERLAISNRELEQFASVASHDLQEPLRKIQAFGDRLKSKAADDLQPDARDYLDRMQNAAARMQTLINDLLAFSRVTSKAQPFVMVDLNQIAHDVLTDLETRIEQTGGQVELGRLPELEADPLQMRQLLQNLIGNALKFHQHGVTPLVRVSSQRVADSEHDGEWYRLSVADNGIGFDEKYLDRIFNVFQRLHGRNVYEGTGVGLAICRKIVERHGGTITASSAPDQGATFRITLPARHNGVVTENTTERLIHHA